MGCVLICLTIVVSQVIDSFFLFAYSPAAVLLERDKPRGSGRSDSWPAVSGWLVSDGELAQVVSDHLRLDLDLVEALAVVDANDGADHLRDDDHVPQVGPDGLWLLSGGGLLLGLVELLDQSVSLALQAALEPAREEEVNEKERGVRVSGTGRGGRRGDAKAGRRKDGAPRQRKRGRGGRVSARPPARARFSSGLLLSSWPGAEQVHELVLVHVKKLFEVDASERELPERSPLWC